LTRRISRRRLLSAGAGLGAALLAPAVANYPVEGKNEWLTPTGQFPVQCLLPLLDRSDVQSVSELLRQPEVRKSVGGVLDTSLHVTHAYNEIGGYQLHMRSYEGGTPGPTLLVSPGDVIRIRLYNELAPNRDDEPQNHNHPHHFNTTNFHFHGGHVSPGGIADNVLRVMEPGQSYDIEIAIPKDHTRGMYWYHPHNHGSADVQVASGMAGAIIVGGNFSDVPEIANAQERVMVLGETVFDSFGTIESFDTLFPETATRFLTVNGQRHPTIQMRPGEVQRWRILHAGYQDDLLMHLDGHALNAIAYDGIDLARMDRQDNLLLTPGQRAEVLVKAGDPGTYEMTALTHSQGYPSPEGPIARIVVSGGPVSMTLPAALPAPPLKSIADSELTGKRELLFSAVLPENDAAGNWQEFSFLVDGRLFDANRVDQDVRLGAVEEWTINNTHEHDHIFHIHTNPFMVTKVNGQPLADPIWRDTAIVPGNGSLTFRSRFEDFTGRYLLHCHMMNHEDMGMMQLVQVS
jgi:FtsP/CotA-like multicopper oxidase with cupredoxin domain